MRVLVSLILRLFFFVYPVDAASNCSPRAYANGIVCVCNSTYCDDVEPLGQLTNDQVAVYTSSKSGKRLTRSKLTFTQGPAPFNTIKVTIHSDKNFQRIHGFGSSFTDSVGVNLRRLSEGARQNLLNSYFGSNGLEYTIGRVPIASTDFSTREYSYLDTPNDFNLSTFGLAQEDFDYKIPFIKTALELTQGQLSLIASPWSAPGWMKTSGQMKGPGQLKGDFNGEYYQAYAKYYVKFFEEYFKQGINFWAVTIQNEPSSGLIPNYGWQTMFMSYWMQR
ncbi:Protein GBA-4 [Aphelenchoides avenae]|nr:Protein GBA-4 [Aphelenchus avenae]